MSKPRHRSFDEIFQARIDELAITLRPGGLSGYRCAVRSFVRYLEMHYPQIHTLGVLRRDPHLLGWMRELAAQDPPLSKGTRRLYMFCLGRLLDDLAWSGQYALPQGLILSTDLPRLDQYLPKPLSPQDDRLLQQQLRAQDDLLAHALLLLLIHRHAHRRAAEPAHRRSA